VDIDAEQLAVRDNPDANRYEIEVAGQLATLEYMRRDGEIVLVHAAVPPSLEGHGIAARVTRYALDAARADGLKVVVHCPYVASYVGRHPEYDDIIVPTE
jgi:predicted GNAT family acetyltransferase